MDDVSEQNEQSQSSAIPLRGWRCRTTGAASGSQYANIDAFKELVDHCPENERQRTNVDALGKIVNRCSEE